MSLVIVTGNPGTGKTTFSHLLAQKTALRYVDLNEHLISTGCVSDYDTDRGSYVVDSDLSKAETRRSFSQGDFLLESHLSHLMAPLDELDHAFLLRCHPRELDKRLREKGFGEAKTRENVEAEVLGVTAAEVYEVVPRERVKSLDVTEGVERAVDLATRVLGGEPTETETVDWLSRLEEDELTRYLVFK